MKSILLFVFSFPVFVFSQSQKNQVEKPATDACPTWNNKDQKSKADYFRFLQTSKGKSNNQNTNPNQRTQYPATPSYSYSLTRSTVPEEQPRYKRNSKHNTAKSNTRTVDEVEEIEKTEEPISSNTKKEEVVPPDNEKKEIVEDKSDVLTEVKIVEKKSEGEDSFKAEEKAVKNKEENKPLVNSEKIKKETKDTGRKVKRLFKKKKRKGKGVDCPDF